VRGAFFASILFGLADSLNYVLLPTMPGVVVYALLITLVLVRPEGFYPELAR
jgi:branched-subunit amino acid ABC-type transport system permease component